MSAPRLNFEWLVGVLLVLLTLLVYYPSWHGEFIWDDESHVVNNPELIEPDGLAKIWTSSESLQYYPLVFTSFRLERALWGLNPSGFHLDNLLLHAASALLLWRLLARLNLPGAWLAAAVFAVHPVNVESVAWISQRKNTLAMVCYLLSFLLYVSSDEEPGRVEGRGSGVGDQVQSPKSELRPHFTYHVSRFTLDASRFNSLYWLSVLAFVLALLSKTAVSPFPLVLLGFAWWKRGKISKLDAWRSAPYFGASLILGLVTMWFERHRNEMFEIVRPDGPLGRLASAGWAVWFYLSKVLAPVHLTVVYPQWQIVPSQLLAYVPALLLAMAVLMVWHYRERMGRGWLFCASYYVLMLLPILGFVNIGFMNYSLVADHWQYFAIIAPIAILIGCFASSFRFGRRSPFGLCIAAAVLATLGTLTWKQARLYADGESFWREAISANPTCPAAHLSLGILLSRKNAAPEAATQFTEALRLKPDYAEARNSLGLAFAQMGRLDEAIGQYELALKRFPYNAAIHFNLAAAYVQQGRTDDVISEYQTAFHLQTDPQFVRDNVALPVVPSPRFFADVHYNFANALLRRNRLTEASSHYQQALQYEPGDVDTHRNLGVAFLIAGQLDAAVSQFQEAVRLAPGLADAHYQLGDAYARKGELAKAVEEFKSALRLKPDHAQARRALEKVLGPK
ncbi:MAG: hypothetical protein C5B50_17325 [Verrucomicrobia bacterium]|nr:MAG: hypothetical protein C5B50_17325 [Verrucomicrobiota bacterium]